MIRTVIITSKLSAEGYTGSKVALVCKTLFSSDKYKEIRDNIIRVKFVKSK